MRSPRARALGKALREARQESGRTLRDFALEIGRDPGVLSRWETGERTPSPEHLAQILTKLGITGKQFDEMIALAKGIDQPQWLAVSMPEQHQQFAALLDLEEASTRITHVAPLLMPGLLQTNDYIRAIMIKGAPPEEVSARVAMRIGRREVLRRHNPLHLLAFVGEAALSQMVGSPHIMAEQLRHLASMSRKSNVDVRVVPFDSGWHAGLEGPFVLIQSTQWNQIVQLESRRSLLLLHQEADVGPYEEAAKLVSTVALDPEESIQLIAKYIYRWEKAT